MMDYKKTTTGSVLAVGLSGGVDSSVAALLLSEEWNRPDVGRTMAGVSHYIWPEGKSCSEETLGRARAVCDQLGIPFVQIDLTGEFARCVVDDFTETYLRGETPNPCVRCNEEIKFGVFYSVLSERLLGPESERNAEQKLYFATGHYVRTLKKDGRWYLLRGKDPDKDQSYMLYKISPGLLPFLRFPLGEYIKPEIVAIAREHNLPSASVKESQDICFVDDDYPAFISRYLKTAGTLGAGESVRRTSSCFPDISGPGKIFDTYGNYLGRHRGYIHYTVGQRKGLGLSDGPWYVVRVEAAENKVIVGRADDLMVKDFQIHESNWFTPVPDGPLGCTVKIRYNSSDIPCSVQADGEGTARVALSVSSAVTPGQSAVFYDGDFVLGGGIIRNLDA